MSSQDFTIDDALIATVTAYIKVYMSSYDGSHDYSHIQRVVRLAQHIQQHTPNTDPSIVTLSALLHDVGDKKYVKAGEDPARMVFDYLRSLGTAEALAEKIQAICLGVSYSSEIKDPQHVVDLIARHPELAVVQDADRLDAIGAVGIGRVFAFGGAKGRTLGQSMEHFDEKLLRLEGMMKTDEGRRLARLAEIDPLLHQDGHAPARDDNSHPALPPTVSLQNGPPSLPDIQLHPRQEDIPRARLFPRPRRCAEHPTVDGAGLRQQAEVDLVTGVLRSDKFASS
ncbi:hypothetical protein G7046_g675 [Stylonectria norvegica]|nr:hypothetical protein G7046_g675 [Stylonectria norvegica]